MIDLTDSHLAIAPAVAARHARPGTALFDELVSAIWADMVAAAAGATYDPALSSPSSWLYTRAIWAAHKAIGGCGDYRSHEVRWRSLASLDAPLGDGEGAVVDLVPCRCRQPDEICATTDLSAKALARMEPIDRELFRLVCWEGLLVKEAARRVGVTKDRASIRMRRAAAALRPWLLQQCED